MDHDHAATPEPTSTPDDGMAADEVVDRLGLSAHPEGGFFRETWRHEAEDGRRGAGTAILYLLAAGHRSHWHRVDAAEVWHFHAGAPLALSMAPGDDTAPSTDLLGVDLRDGQRPQLVVPVGWWQSATSTGAWSLVSCTVSPAFTFDGFELAPPDFAPGG